MKTSILYFNELFRSFVICYFFPEDEHDLLRGLKFPNLDTSDSSEAEFALRPKSKPQKMLKKKMKAHPKDLASPSYSDELISITYAEQKDKHRRSSSTSSRTESAVSSSAQNASDVADLQNLGALDFESENQTEFFEGNAEIQDWKIAERENHRTGTKT